MKEHNWGPMLSDGPLEEGGTCLDCGVWATSGQSFPCGLDGGDNEVSDLVQLIPSHFANLAFVNAQSSTGTCTATAPASTATWNLTSLSISMAGGVSGVNAKVTIYDGAVGGTVLFAAFLNGPGALGTGLGSVGTIQDIPLPKSPQGIPGIQATPGNAMNIQVIGTGGNAVSINARFSDGLP